MYDGTRHEITKSPEHDEVFLGKDGKNILDRMRLDERSAVVTGAGQGIGRAYAHALGEAGTGIREALIEAIGEAISAGSASMKPAVSGILKRNRREAA